MANKNYLLQQELDSIKDAMGVAMQNANTEHVQYGYITDNMKDVLMRFFHYAQKVEEAGA